MKTKSISPRVRNNKNHQRFLDPLPIDNRSKDSQIQTNDSIDKFLATEIPHAYSDSDKMFVYQKAFDFLINEFQICKPLLSRIKKQYDMMCTDLIAKKRELSFNNISISSSEDIFPDTINEIRNVRMHEFAQKKSESEQLLDQMTKLRIKRSELLQQFENLTMKDNELSASDSTSTEKIIELNSKISDINDFIKSTENSTLMKKKQLDDLNDEISRTQQSKDELAEKDQYFQSQICILEKEEKELQINIDRMDQINLELSKEITDLQNRAETLNKKKNSVSDKLKYIEISYQSKEDELRNLIKESDLDIDSNLPIEEILSKIYELNS